jgi:hypothetical protein
MCGRCSTSESKFPTASSQRMRKWPRGALRSSSSFSVQGLREFDPSPVRTVHSLYPCQSDRPSFIVSKLRGAHRAQSAHVRVNGERGTADLPARAGRIGVHCRSASERVGNPSNWSACENVRTRSHILTILTCLTAVAVWQDTYACATSQCWRLNRFQQAEKFIIPVHSRILDCSFGPCGLQQPSILDDKQHSGAFRPLSAIGPKACLFGGC